VEKNKKLMIVIIILLVVLLGIVVSVSVVAYNMVNNSTDKPVVIENVSSIDIMKTITVNLDEPMTINLLPDTDGTSHAINMKVAIAIDTANKKDAELIEKIQGSQAIIKDAVNYVVSNKTVEQVKGNANQDILKEEILLRLQDEFKTNIIYSIYFEAIYYM